MARVTVEDCINKVPNRFKLVLMAAKRARDIERGAKPSVVRDNDKSTVLALREIAEDAVSLENLEELTRQSIINNEAELSYEQDQEEERLKNINEEEIGDEDLNDDEFLEEDDDDWDVSDNPYNRAYSSKNAVTEDSSEDLDYEQQGLSDADLSDEDLSDAELSDAENLSETIDDIEYEEVED